MSKKVKKPTKSSYIGEFIKSTPSVLRYKMFKIVHKDNKIGKHKDITFEYSVSKIKEAIKSDEPFAAIRFGGTELSAINGYEKRKYHFKKDYSKGVYYSMKNNGGFFPTTKENLDNYGEFMLSILKDVDYLGITGLHMENYFYKHYASQAKPIQNWALDPLLGGWSHLLEGKKVLVISPFEEEILSQYEKRELLFPKESNILPKCELKTIKAVQTIGKEEDKRFDNWFKALDYMKMEILKVDFDIALVGAGAYGSPLCLFIKSLNKQAIQSGGATQLLFGIIGKRWENRNYVSKHINEHWIRPQNKPLGAEEVEDGCYW
ncbi:MAG: hypothetical protein ACOX28_02700 [Bacilli bacterium]|jgi:hypothetical protein